MKSYKLFLLCHVVVATAAGGVTATMITLSTHSWGVPLALALTGTMAAASSWILARRLGRGLSAIESAVATGEDLGDASTGIWEVDRTVGRVGQYSQRWAEAIANAQEQMQATDSLLVQMDRRASRTRDGRAGSSAYGLRQLLGRIGGSVDAGLAQIVQTNTEIAHNTQEIAAGAEAQTDTLAKTAGVVEQISINIDAVSRNADSAQSAVGEVHESARTTLEHLQTLMSGIENIRTHVETSERRIRSMSDRWQEIISIVETIAAISSRTDLLALNASIESMRAGEHGRGFAVVAEEVRKLAEQAAQATCEITGLIESAQIETNESISIMSKDRGALETESQGIAKAGKSLERIIELGKESGTRVDEISHATERQFQLARDLVLAVERLSDGTKAGRSQAEKTCWTAKSLADTMKQIDSVLGPLRRCSQTNSGISNELGDPATTSDSVLPDETLETSLANGEIGQTSWADPVSTPVGAG